MKPVFHGIGAAVQTTGTCSTAKAIFRRGWDIFAILTKCVKCGLIGSYEKILDRRDPRKYMVTFAVSTIYTAVTVQ